MRVVLVVGDLLTRHGLAVLLDRDPTIELVGSAATLSTGRRLLRDHRPDVLIVGSRLPPLAQAGAPLLLQQARTDGIRTVIIADEVDPILADHMLADDAGGWGWLVRDRLEDPTHLVNAVTRVARGGTVIDDAIVEELAERRRVRRRPVR